MPTEKNIKTPEELYKHFEAYKEDCKSNPKKENFWSSKSDKQVSVNREIPYTWDGFEIFLRKNKIIAKLDDYIHNKDDRYSKYAAIIRTINLEIREDKMTGAIAGIYQHNIIARDLGLSEKKDITEESKVTHDLSKLSAEDLKRLEQLADKISDTGGEVP